MSAQDALDFLLNLQKEGHALENLNFSIEYVDNLGVACEKSVVDINLHRCTSSVVLEIPEQ